MIPDYSGKLLTARYLLRRRIGYGGMATVYEAVDRELNKPVAVKILNPNYASQAEYLARFRQEAREAARIRHDNLVDVTDQGSTADGLAYFVMEFLRGETLQNYLHPGDDESRPVPWRTLLSIVAQVCDALQHAHEHGVIHRDIKPGNIFLMSRRKGEFRVKVLDLGIAKVLDGYQGPGAQSLTRPSQGTPGTPEYMSPEQVRGVPAASPQTDIYAVGVMMYRMLTGTLPFYSSVSPYDVMEQHCKQSPEPPRERAPSLGIPAALEREVLRALAKRPEDRQTSAQELGDTLRALEAEEIRREREEEARTAQFHITTEPPRRTWARLLSYLAAGFSGMAFSTALFMVFVLLLPLLSGQGEDIDISSTTTSVTASTDATTAPTSQTDTGSNPTSSTDTTGTDTDNTTTDSTTSGSESDSDTDSGGTTGPVQPPPPPPLTQLRNFLRTKKYLFKKRCGDFKIFSTDKIPVNLVLSPSAAPPLRVEAIGMRKDSPLGDCVATQLRRFTFPALAQTSFQNIDITF